ncbi:4HBT domain-containing protein [Mycena venus]|uniref:4HBT domain-containing protein n=1 Tax=Mycena venus TaxID=2733690 RepID=A0A8H6Y4E3_9AGAR|nr:4HBT domain-containing protein [Mycena venus]
MSVSLLRRRATRQVQRVSTTLSPPHGATSAPSPPSPSSPPPPSAHTLSAPSTPSIGAPRPPPPSDATSPESLAYTAALEAELQALPALRALREEADADEWYETRPHASIPESARANKLTSGALRGPGRLALFPLARVRKDESKAVVFVHLGRGLCGHDGIVHGGLLAALLDDVLWRNAILNLPEKAGMTVTLSLKYKAPTRADQFIIIKSELVELEGRKAFVAGRVETLNGTLLVEADGLYIQPRSTKLLNKADIRQLIGDPPPDPALVGEGQRDKLKASVVPPK